MKNELVRKRFGPVHGRAELRLWDTPEKLSELRQALAVVNKYKKRAMRTASVQEKMPTGRWWGTQSRPTAL